MTGNYNGYDLVLNPVIPGIELKDFKHETGLYKEAHNDQLFNIPIGIEANGLLLVVGNESREVKLEDYQRDLFEIISENLSKLIKNL